jgi:hypothetical protein
MTVSSQLQASLFILLSTSTLLLSVTEQANTVVPYFRGPGYLNCSVADFFGPSDCYIDDDPNCTDAEIESTCDESSFMETFDSAFANIYFPLICNCEVAYDCAGICTFNTDEQPASPIVERGETFTGVGTVLCPALEYFVWATSCVPTVNNVTSCGTCDVTDAEDNWEYSDGDEFAVISLPCECLSVYDCAASCTFTAGNVSGPVAVIPSTIATPVSSSPITAPQAPTTAVAVPVLPLSSGPVVVPVPTAVVVPAVSGPTPVPVVANVTTVAAPQIPISGPMMAVVPVARSPIAAPSSRNATSFASTTTPSHHRHLATFMMMIVMAITLLGV